MTPKINLIALFITITRQHNLKETSDDRLYGRRKNVPCYRTNEIPIKKCYKVNMFFKGINAVQSSGPFLYFQNKKCTVQIP